MRRLAALTLAGIGIGRGADKALSWHLPLLTDAAPDLRRTATHGLGAVGQEAVPALTKALRGENSDVLEGAPAAIGRVQASG